MLFGPLLVYFVVWCTILVDSNFQVGRGIADITGLVADGALVN